ncbi:MAG: glycogen debranching protein GlgX [Rhizobiaceae bacterium]|nr:glycogen debranching protein GlgX [Rhizobiaceae bacterium]
MPRPGIALTPHGVEFSVFSRSASKIELCLFAERGGHEIGRLPMERHDGHVWHIEAKGAQPGMRYGYRAHGVYAPERGLWFDPSKLLVDPYAVELDRPFAFSPDLSSHGADTGNIVPRAVITASAPVARQEPHFAEGGLIYEVNVRALTMLHPDVPEAERGTIKALAHPAVIAHLKRIGVSAVELMPITAWIDERHLPALGLRNGWGYNPVALMALDPRLCPGGIRELADTVAALHADNIGVILDLVFNHTGESDQLGPTISMRGLDSLAYYRAPDGHPGLLINDTGTGNTLACDHPVMRELVLDTLRHFVNHAGIDGFRFDLAPIIGRDMSGFRPDAELIGAMLADPVLSDRVLIAEPWDIGPGGYQLGNFPDRFLEWNDWARDTMRQFWRGDGRKLGDLATVLAGSSSIFEKNGSSRTRTVNFIAAHDGFTLRDLVSFETKHNELNGEHNRDGHGENYSWNNGVEGDTTDIVTQNRRVADVRALLATLFATRGAIMLTAGDEMGRTQHGNNNAYAQDNTLTWLDWPHADDELIGHVAALSAIRHRFGVFSDTHFFDDGGEVEWLGANGEPMQVADWEETSNGFLTMLLRTTDLETGAPARLAVAFNRTDEQRRFALPGGAKCWKTLLGNGLTVDTRSVAIFLASGV